MERTSSERNSSRHAKASQHALTVYQHQFHCKQAIQVLAERVGPKPFASGDFALDNSVHAGFSHTVS